MAFIFSLSSLPPPLPLALQVFIEVLPELHSIRFRVEGKHPLKVLELVDKEVRRALNMCASRLKTVIYVPCIDKPGHNINWDLLQERRDLVVGATSINADMLERQYKAFMRPKGLLDYYDGAPALTLPSPRSARAMRDRHNLNKAAPASHQITKPTRTGFWSYRWTGVESNGDDSRLLEQMFGCLIGEEINDSVVEVDFALTFSPPLPTTPVSAPVTGPGEVASARPHPLLPTSIHPTTRCFTTASGCKTGRTSGWPL